MGNLAIADQTVLTTLVSQNEVYVDFSPDENSYLTYLEQARQSDVPISDFITNIGLANEAGYPHKARFMFINNELDPNTGSIKLRAIIDNKKRLFTPGLYARVQISRATEAKAVLVDNKSIMTDQTQRFVYVIEQGNTAIRKDITTGRMVEGLRVVNDGLSAGDKVIISGSQKIYASQTLVSPTETSMTASMSGESFK